ncbi:uncharacterized protein LOC124644837 isoform X2 [Helicoverpa zea]|uniref:uncharacterized protein LOC124644837 isoform X2 n=1 Tax=Helicoverpa zea TaxID=7113 RepID=UPI001F589C44|nr:uncharacterized protein LOC124644837 isoform X2 [Helicoverpa zea]
MKILPLFILVACVVCSVLGQDEERPAAPSRGLLKRGSLAKGKPTTTTTTPAPQEEAEYEDDGDYPAEEQQEASTEAPSSTTEGKKLVGSGVRPFRSNTELLEILKRKRAQAAEDNKSKKRFNNAPVTREVANEEAPAPAPKPSRGRFGRPATRSVQESEDEPQVDSAAPPARSGRTFRRGGN